MPAAQQMDRPHSALVEYNILMFVTLLRHCLQVAQGRPQCKFIFTRTSHQAACFDLPQWSPQLVCVAFANFRFQFPLGEFCRQGVAYTSAYAHQLCATNMSSTLETQVQPQHIAKIVSICIDFVMV